MVSGPVDEEPAGFRAATAVEGAVVGDVSGLDAVTVAGAGVTVAGVVLELGVAAGGIPDFCAAVAGGTSGLEPGVVLAATDAGGVPGLCFGLVAGGAVVAAVLAGLEAEFAGGTEPAGDAATTLGPAVVFEVLL